MPDKNMLCNPRHPALHALLIAILMLSLESPAHSAALETLTTTKQSVPEKASFYGRVQAIKQATVSAETQGRVEDVRVNVGDTVTAGTTLLTMTSTEQSASLNQAEANLADAQSNLVNDQAEYQRINDLYKKNFVSKAEMDRISARLSASKARVSSAEAALRSAKQQLSYTEIKAPYSGIVSERYIEVGEAVRPGTLLLSGYNPSGFRVEVDVPQTTAEKVRAKQSAQIKTIPAGTPSSAREITPETLILYPTVDPATSTVRIRLELPEGIPDLFPGQFVQVSFNTGEQERLLIPAGCVVYRAEVAAVYVVRNNQPELRQIRPGAMYGDNLEVLAGVAPGESIAVDPVAAAEALVAAKDESGE